MDDDSAQPGRAPDGPPDDLPGDLPVRVRLATRPLGILGIVRVARRNFLELIPEALTRQPIFSGKTGKRWHLVADPGALRRILKDNADNYPKSDVVNNLLRPAIGQGLFTSEGAAWRWQRRASAPVFSARNISALTPIMSAAAGRSVARMERGAAAAPDHVVDVHAETIAATFEVIADVTFSGDGDLDRVVIHRAIDAYVAQAGRLSLMDMLGVPSWVPRPARLFEANPVRHMKHLADRAIARRLASGPQVPPDLLDLMSAASDPQSGRQMDAGLLRDNLLTFIVAGHETTALALAWSLYLLANAPQVQDRVRAEAVAALGRRIATDADLPALPLTRQVVQEALRLYPPVPLLARMAAGPDMLCDRQVRRGDAILLPTYALHRSHLLWQRPDAFDPGRFDPAASHDRFAWLPFGAGQRVCIGAGFAMSECVIMLASQIARHRFALVPGRLPVPRMVLTLRPEGGVHLRVTPV